MPDVIPQIEKGKTTRADLIGKLGDPTSQSRDSEGNETLMFIEKAAIWEGGAWGFVNPGRSNLRMLTVQSKNGVVTNYTTSETYQSTPMRR